jgi:hypothetical protein
MQTHVVGFEEFKNWYATNDKQWKIIQALQQGNMTAFPQYSLQDGFVFKGLKLCLPKCSLRRQLVLGHHNQGHFGRDKTVAMLPQKFHWHGLVKDVG